MKKMKVAICIDFRTADLITITPPIQEVILRNSLN